VSGKYVEELRQLIQFPTSQKWPHWGESLISRSSYRLMRLIGAIDHGSEFQNGEIPTVPAHAPLKEENGTRGRESHSQTDGQKNRNNDGHHQQNASAVDNAL
jgi:hypothetical protein